MIFSTSNITRST